MKIKLKLPKWLNFVVVALAVRSIVRDFRRRDQRDS